MDSMQLQLSSVFTTATWRQQATDAFQFCISLTDVLFSIVGVGLVITLRG